jgi:hypothetical protein
VPWNNNNAENAIQAFAELRRVIGGTSTEKGLREYLVLLSICETCKRRGINFLDFMLSGKTNIEELVTGRSSQIKSVREKERQCPGKARPATNPVRAFPKEYRLSGEATAIRHKWQKSERLAFNVNTCRQNEMQLYVVRVINDRCKVRTHDGRRGVISPGSCLQSIRWETVWAKPMRWSLWLSKAWLTKMMWRKLSIAPRALCDDTSGASRTEEWRRSEMAAGSSISCQRGD